MIYDFKIDSPETKHIWDSFVDKHPNGWICHLSGWKDLLECSFPHIYGHFLTLFDERSNTIEAALPVYSVRSWLKGNRLVSIPFATTSDPLAETKKQIRELLNAAIKKGRENKTSFIEIRTFNIEYKGDSRITENRFYKFHYLKLIEPCEIIQKNFHRSSVNRRIKRSLKGTLSLKLGENENDLLTFYQLYLITKKRLHLPPIPYHFFENLWKIFYPKQQVSLLLAMHHDRAIAGFILLKYKEQILAEFSGSDVNYKQYYPNHFFIGMLFRWGIMKNDLCLILEGPHQIIKV